jgi:hypothetical protein
MTKYPRSIYFLQGKAIGTFNLGRHDDMHVMMLPSDHYDFLGPINIIGKTQEKIQQEANEKYYSCPQ